MTLNSTSFNSHLDASEDKIITDVIAHGPAIIGMPMREYAISSFVSASFSSFGVDLLRDIRASSISMPVLKKRIPPTILNAETVILYKEKMISYTKEKNNKNSDCRKCPF